MFFKVVIVVTSNLFLSLNSQMETQSIITPPPTPCIIPAKESKIEKIVEKKIATSPVKKRKIVLNNNINKAMLGYQYGKTWYPIKFKLQVGDDIFTEFKDDKESKINNLITSKEIILEGDTLEICWEYEWYVSTYNGKKKQKFKIEPGVEYDLEFDWNAKNPEHIVLKKNYKQIEKSPSKSEKT